MSMPIADDEISGDALSKGKTGHSGQVAPGCKNGTGSEGAKG